MDSIKTVKVRPYPIEAVITGRAAPFSCKILKVTLRGALVDPGGMQLQVTEKLRLAFEIPHFKDKIESDVVVVKFYDKFSGDLDNKKIQRWDELHFDKISPASRIRIERFLKAIRQTEKY